MTPPPARRGWNPASWAGWMPNGIGQIKPNHYLDMARTVWENRDSLPFAWRILTRGVCDGCALGTYGLKDWTMRGPHLCTVRLSLLRLNTMGPLDMARLADAEALRAMSGAELRALGRLPYPALRRAGERGFRRIGWPEAIELAGARLAGAPADRVAFYLTARGLTNETYYVAQKAARFLGTNSVDNAARICHSPSTYALRDALGIAASSCSYSDWIGTDLLVLIGSDTPNNQPVTTKYIYYAKQAGTRVVVVNPYREPGLERYWVPSALESAVFGTRLADEFFEVHTGGDAAFFTGVLKALIAGGAVDSAFIEAHTSGFGDVSEACAAADWADLERRSGAPRGRMEELARQVGAARSAVFVWSMGATQHRNGAENVRAVINLALARGFVGREKCGVMPIRGHSGVQGSAEMGCYSTAFPGGLAVTPENAETFARMWGFVVPPAPGLTAPEMLRAADAGELDVLYSVGGNFLETMPEPGVVERSLGRVPLRVHQDIVLSSQMLVPPNDAVLLLPAATRYEQVGGGTETSTERRVIFSPEIPGRRIGEARAEWEAIMEIVERAAGPRANLIHFDDAAAVRREIATAVPAYDGIQNLSRYGDAMQWGGPRLCVDGRFDTPDGKARFTLVDSSLEQPTPPEGFYRLSTRRGKQFNSMVQSAKDPLNGATRDAVLIAAEDAAALGIADGDRVELRNDVGSLACRARIARIRPGNVQVYWPEGNVLIRAGVEAPGSRVPDYNAFVQVVPCSPPS